MVLKFLKIEEDLNYNIHNIEFQKTKTVFSTTTLKKEEYRITSIEDLHENICVFLDRRVTAQYENHGYLFETNENIIQVKFYHPDYAANCVEFTLFRVEYYLISHDQLHYDKDFFNKEFFEKWEDCPYEIRIIEIATIKQEEDEDEEITIVQEYEHENGKIPIIKTFKEDKCIICLENEPNILYVHCRHIPTCSNVKKLRIETNALSVEE